MLCSLGSAMGSLPSRAAVVLVALLLAASRAWAAEPESGKALSASEQAYLEKLRSSYPELFRAAGSTMVYWPNGSTIRFGFLDGTPAQRTMVRELVDEWLHDTGLHSEFVDPDAADVRVSFEREESWSYLGTNARSAPKGEPTLMLGFSKSAGEEARHYARHEIGHVFGLIHEQQNPNARLPWDLEAISKSTGLAPPDVEALVEPLRKDDPFYQAKPFDPYSIMTYPLPAGSVRGGFEFPTTTTLSMGDHAFMTRLYPRQESATAGPGMPSGAALVPTVDAPTPTPMRTTRDNDAGSQTTIVTLALSALAAILLVAFAYRRAVQPPPEPQGQIVEPSSVGQPVDPSAASGDAISPPLHEPPPSHRPLRAFCSYAHEDEAHQNELTKRLVQLRRQGLVEAWHDRLIVAGDDWTGTISEHLETADLILLLISPDFLASDYCHDEEMRRALERHDAATARVVPIIVRPTDDWEEAHIGNGRKLGTLQVIPRDAVAVTVLTRQTDLDSAWVQVVREIRRVIDAIRRARSQTA
ncbi:TIR domain-containing protein [Candidatus Binatia bacterium]|nr:TIR domain-containing protein [Candidatus Binatia bacterium]